LSLTPAKDHLGRGPADPDGELFVQYRNRFSATSVLAASPAFCGPAVCTFCIAIAASLAILLLTLLLMPTKKPEL
jgi:hypothetical protein